MKKSLLVLAILAIGAIGFADAKSDYQSGLNLFNEGKREQAVKVLEGVSKGKDKEYTAKSNFLLGIHYAQLNDRPAVKKYLEPLVNDTKYLTDAERLEVSQLLYLIAFQEKNYTMAEKYIKNMNMITKGENYGFVAEAIALDFLQNKNANALSKYNQAMTSKNNEFKAGVNYYVGVYFLRNGNVPEAQKYLQEVYKLGNTESLVNAGIALAEIELNKNNVAGVEKILLDLDKRFNGKNNLVVAQLGNVYYGTGNYAKAEQYFKKLETLEPEQIGVVKALLLAASEQQNKESNIKKYYNEFKTFFPEKTNEVLGNIYFEYRDFPLSEKYLRKAVTEDKDNNVRLVLVNFYVLTGKLDQAKKEAAEAAKLKVPGAAELLKELEKIK